MDAPTLRRLHRWSWLLLAVFVLLALPAGWVLYSRWRADQQLATALATADRLDPGWRWEDLLAAEKAEAVPEAEDAGLLVAGIVRNQPAWALVSAGAPPGASLDSQAHPERRLPDNGAAAARKILDQAGWLADARRLADRPRGRLAVEQDAEVLMTVAAGIDRSTKVYAIAVMLCFDALCRTHAGDPDGAVDSCRAALHAARLLAASTPLFLGLGNPYLDLRGAALDRLEYSLAQGEPTPAALARLQATLTAEEAVPPFRRYARAMRAMVDRAFRDAARDEDARERFLKGIGARSQDLTTGSDTLDRLLAPLLRRSALRSFPEEHAAAIAYLTRVVAMTQDTPTERQFATLAALNAEAPTQLHFVALFTSSHHRLLPIALNSQARLRAAIAAIAAERFRHDRGRWPEKLEELVPDYLPAVPLDPFTGTPLRYRRLPDGLVLYAIGRNAEDDGGIVVPRKGDDEPPDIGFRLWDVAKRRQSSPPEEAGKP